MELDAQLNRFRLSSRELFNQYFRVDDPFNRDGWVWEQRHSELQSVLFRMLVIDPANLPEISYGVFHPNIGVELRNSVAPMHLNREIDSGYWDHPLEQVTREAVLGFISFFDWDVLSYRDNQYVRIKIVDWQSHQEAISKHALIECQYVRFVRRDV